MNCNKFIKAMRWMRSHKKLIIFVITMILIAILASCLNGEQAGTATMAVGMLITGVENGKHVVDGPLTTDLSREGSPDLLLNEIDQQIVKIRPMSTPIDQISRYGGSKHAGSMIVDFYSVDTKATRTTLTQDVESVDEVSSGESPTTVIHTANDDIFDPTDTILVLNTPGYTSDNNTLSEESTQDLELYVLNRDSNGVTVMAVNGPTINGVSNCIPDISSGSILVRMGRAASELDVQSPQFESLPKKSRNLCQIFKTNFQKSS